MSLQVTAINYSLGGLLVAGGGFFVIDSRASDKSKSSWPIEHKYFVKGLETLYPYEDCLHATFSM